MLLLALSGPDGRRWDRHMHVVYGLWHPLIPIGLDRRLVLAVVSLVERFEIVVSRGHKVHPLPIFLILVQRGFGDLSGLFW